MGDAAAKATEAAAPKAAEAATPAARRIASMPTRGYEAARDAAMALERKRTYGCIRPVCRCIVGATSLSACGAGCLPSDLGRA